MLRRTTNTAITAALNIARQNIMQIRNIPPMPRVHFDNAPTPTQPPMPDSQTWVKLLHAEGWTFIPITSQTSDIPAQELRKRRLEELFGDIFYNFHILETGQDKEDVLAEFHGTGLYWVEDKWVNAMAGLKYGLNPLFISHPYNQEYSHPEITRVNNWKEIHSIIRNNERS